MSTEPTGQKRGSDNRPWSQLAGVALAAVVLVSALGVIPTTTTAQENQTFIIEQGDKCIQVTPLGNGSQTVEEFYDYRSPDMDQTGLYSSYGTTDIQKSQVSQIFIYHGSNVYSLVFLHDKFGDGGGGFVATADISGLPPEGEWVVEDDTYTNRDDTFNHSNGTSHIEWASNGNRTDGAVFRGLGSPNYTTITVAMKFNEESSRYPFEKWEGPPEANQIERWIVRSGTGETTELDMDQPVEISPGTCSGGVNTFTPAPSGANTTTASTGTAEATATTAAAPPTAATATPISTTTAALSPTATTTPLPTATVTETPQTTPTATPTTTDSSAATPATTAAAGTPTTTGTGGMVGTTQTSGNGSGGSEAFGPGFGVGVVLVAVAVLAGVALARRDD
jgi:hypothetical protein